MSTSSFRTRGNRPVAKGRGAVHTGSYRYWIRRICLSPYFVERMRARRHIIPVCVQHAPCIGSYLDRMFSAFPCGLDPDNRIAREEFRPLGKQDIRVILISGQRDHLAEFFKIPGMAALQDRLAEARWSLHRAICSSISSSVSSYIRQWTGRGIRSTAARSPEYW